MNYVIINGLICKEVDGETPIIRQVHKRSHFAYAKTEQLLKADY